MKKLTALAAGTALALLTFGCGGNDNTAGSNSNAVVINNNATRNTTVSTNTNSNSNANRGTYNANISQEDYEKNKDTFGQKAKDLGDKVGSGLSDGWLWVKTRGALIAVDGLEESGINVDVNNGVITLRGMVPSQDQIKKADTAAKGISGNKGVQNQLKVGACNGNANAAKKK